MSKWKLHICTFAYLHICKFAYLHICRWKWHICTASRLCILSHSGGDGVSASVATGGQTNNFSFRSKVDFSPQKTLRQCASPLDSTFLHKALDIARHPCVGPQPHNICSRSFFALTLIDYPSSDQGFPIKIEILILPEKSYKVNLFAWRKNLCKFDKYSPKWWDLGECQKKSGLFIIIITSTS